MPALLSILRRGSMAFIASAVAFLLAISLAPAAQAAEIDTWAEADRLMGMSYRDFLQAKQDRPAGSPFNWFDDGCSGPGAVQWVYRDLFDGPCQQHDFGYRNLGPKAGGLQLWANEDGRAFVDNRFGQEMDRLCRRNFDSWYQRVNRNACLDQAAAVWAAVRHGGRDAFYAR